MKKTMTMIVFILALGSQAIAGGFSALKLRTNSNTPLKVIIDGQFVSIKNSVVQINSVRAGNHSLQVFRILKSYNSYNEEPLFFGEIYLPQNTVTHALIKHHQFVIEEQFALHQKPQNVKPTHRPHGNYYETKPITWITQQSNPYPVCGTQNPGYYQEPIYDHIVKPIVEVYPMNAQEFNLLKNTIENQWFSDGKKLVLKQALSSGHLVTTNQVNSLIDLFSFSGDRLEIAKMAYLNTVDKENYFQVYNSLHWNSSMENLSSYIASL